MNHAQCPFCDWSVRDAVPIAVLAKALMHHLRLQHAPHDPARVDQVQLSSGFGATAKVGFVELSINNEITQLEVGKAREVHRMMGEAIEAAITDGMIYHFFKTRFEITDERRLADILYDFREVRQGSKSGAIS